MERFPIRGWEPLVPGDAGVIFESQLIRNRQVRLGFPHRAGWYRSGGHIFRPRAVKILHMRRNFRTEHVILSSPHAG